MTDEKTAGEAWKAAAKEAADYFTANGPEERMTPEQREKYENLTQRVQEAADKHDEARGFDGPRP